MAIAPTLFGPSNNIPHQLVQDHISAASDGLSIPCLHRHRETMPRTEPGKIPGEEKKSGVQQDDSIRDAEAERRETATCEGAAHNAIPNESVIVARMHDVAVAWELTCRLSGTLRTNDT